MAKRKADPGLEYMISLGFSRAKSFSGLEDQIAKVSDRSTAKRIMAEMDRRENDGKRDLIRFYKMINENYDISLAVQSAYDADILRKACNWISAHKSAFGDTILEVGCDCGVISCFLSKMFPDAKIVAIDRCAEAIENAKRLAEKQGVQNVSFITSDLKDFEGAFDTVFSMRTMHENYDAKQDLVDDLSEQAEVFKNSLQEYAKALSDRLTAQGKLISIERIGRTALLLGWMEALSEADLLFDLSCYEELLCNEINEESAFQAFICFKGIDSEISPKELFDYACSKYLDYSKAFYGGWDAQIVFENRRKTLIEGYKLEYQDPPVKVRASLWTHQTDETCLVSHNNNNGTVYTAFHDISQKDALIEDMRRGLEEARQSGMKVKITKMSGSESDR